MVGPRTILYKIYKTDRLFGSTELFCEPNDNAPADAPTPTINAVRCTYLPDWAREGANLQVDDVEGGLFENFGNAGFYTPRPLQDILAGINNNEIKSKWLINGVRGYKQSSRAEGRYENIHSNVWRRINFDQPVDMLNLNQTQFSPWKVWYKTQYKDFVDLEKEPHYVTIRPVRNNEIAFVSAVPKTDDFFENNDFILTKFHWRSIDGNFALYNIFTADNTTALFKDNWYNYKLLLDNLFDNNYNELIYKKFTE